MAGQHVLIQSTAEGVEKELCTKDLDRGLYSALKVLLFIEQVPTEGERCRHGRAEKDGDWKIDEDEME